MNPNKLFPLIVTDKLAETKAYYVDKAGFSVTYDRPKYLQVRHGGDDGPELCFMTPDAAPTLGAMSTFAGGGLVVSIPTDSADDKCADMKTRGAKVIVEPNDQPWGWRSFTAVDPNGVLLDFFHVKTDSAVADATG